MRWGQNQCFVHARTVCFSLLWRAAIAAPRLTGQPCCLRFKVAGDAGVEPALDLLGQIKYLDRHGEVLCKSGARGRSAGGPR
jgi:hypothetical protein